MSSDHKAHPRARLCHVIKSDTFDGYGFNLHAEKGKPGQYIGKVDEGSPAEAAGLRQGDRILEVNGVSIASESHKQVVQRIKALCAETKLLVVDPDDEVVAAAVAAVAQTESTSAAVTETVANAIDPTNASDAGSDGTDGKATTASESGASADGEPADGDEYSATTNNGRLDDGQNGATGLNLSMTAAELRAKLAAKKKFDPRKENIDFKKKFDVVQKL